MAAAQIFFDPAYETAVIYRPGAADARRQLRDERQAAHFARELGFVISSTWRVLSSSDGSSSWQCAQLAPVD